MPPLVGLSYCRSNTARVPEKKRHRETLGKEAPEVGEVEGQHEAKESKHRVRADRLEPARHHQRRCNRRQGQDALDGKEGTHGFCEQGPHRERQDIGCKKVVAIELLVLDRALSQLPPELVKVGVLRKIDAYRVAVPPHRDQSEQSADREGPPR